MFDIAEFLKQSSLFENAPEHILKKVSDIIHIRNINSKEELFHKGDSGQSMYIIVSGKIKIHDGDLCTAELGPKDVFGEMAALDEELRTASVTAINDSILLEITRDKLFDLGSKEPELARCIIHFLCQREKHFIDDITENSLKIRTLTREFEIGKEIQEGFLPASLPELPGWSISAHFKAAKEVAGDFYDVFEIASQNKVAIVIGDVCGKGIGAALFMSLFRTLIRANLLAGDFTNHIKNEDSISNEFKQTATNLLQNTAIVTNNYVAITHADAFMFSTLFLGLLDLESGEIIYINAGHEPPAIINQSGIKQRLEPTGPAIGIFKNASFDIKKFTLVKNDIFLAFTDGVTEAVNEKNEQYSSSRLFSYFLEDTLETNIKNSFKAIIKDLANFTESVEQFDDITLVGVKRIN
jgi:serine phosphatase RsbU (regulator of sigma subunit)